MRSLVAACIVVASLVPACDASRGVGTRIATGTSEPARPEVPEHGGIRRTRSRDGAHLLLRTSANVGGWAIGLVGSPEVASERVGITFSAPQLADLFGDTCEVRVMVNGVLLGVLEQEHFRPARSGRDAMIAARLPLSQLTALAAGERVALRICGEEVRLEEEPRALLAEFLLQYLEEGRWNDPVEVQALTAVPEESAAPPADPAPGEAP